MTRAFPRREDRARATDAEGIDGDGDGLSPGDRWGHSGWPGPPCGRVITERSLLGLLGTAVGIPLAVSGAARTSSMGWPRTVSTPDSRRRVKSKETAVTCTDARRRRSERAEKSYDERAGG